MTGEEFSQNLTRLEAHTCAANINGFPIRLGGHARFLGSDVPMAERMTVEFYWYLDVLVSGKTATLSVSIRHCPFCGDPLKGRPTETVRT